MPDLGKVSLSPSSSGGALARCPTLKPLPPSGDEMGFKTLDQGCCDYCDERPGGGGGGGGGDDDACNEDSVRVSRRICGVRVKRGANNGKCLLEDYVGAWVQKKVDLGFSPSHCFLPFLVGAKKMVECLGCDHAICPGEEVFCSVRNCQGVYHLMCAKERLGLSDFRKFKCPQHACFLCKQKFQWRCVRCSITAHDKCAAWPDEVIHLANQPRRAICWRHPADWRLDKENMAPTSDMEEVFSRLPLPYVDEEFKIDSTWKDLTENKLEPTPYVHIRRNVYLVKKKRNDADVDVGCTNCKPMCGEDCVCRVQCISCSKACHCPENCSNRPFRKDKKIKIVKTELCGWGVEAAEPIKKGEFVIEYIGEVIDDALCEQRLWDMKYKGAKNFYMCEIRKDFTIDATFKGNASRFLNHSCEPNCVLEKWQAEGELRVGVFAARSIKIGEPLTYDYRFVQFGPEVRCFCGAENCQGFLGTKRNVGILDLCWGAKRKRSSSPCLALVTT